MNHKFNKTEADFAYERYGKMGEISPEQDIPADDLEPVGTITAQSTSEGTTEAENRPVKSSLESLEPALGRRADRSGGGIAASPTERDELLVSDAILAAGAAGLTESPIDYAEEDEELLENENEDLPLEDIPDADELEAGTPVDPVSPPVDAMPGTDVVNGSHGDE